MDFTLVWLKNGQEQDTERTADCLRVLLEAENISLIADHDFVENNEWTKRYKRVVGLSFEGKTIQEQINLARASADGQYTMCMENGDVIEKNYISCVSQMVEKAEAEHIFKNQRFFMTGKSNLEDKADDFFGYKVKQDIELIDMEVHFSTFPRFFGGTFISTEYFCKHAVREDLPYDFEKYYLLPLVLEKMQVPFVGKVIYKYAYAKEGDSTFYSGVYEEGWYQESVHNFWLGFLKTITEKHGYIPEFAQYYAMFCLGARFRANLDNTNKHIIPDEEAYDYMKSYEPVFAYLDDSTILNARSLPFAKDDVTLQQLYLRIKYNHDDMQFDHYSFKGKAYLGYGNVLITPVASQTVNIKYMEYTDGHLEIDASVSSILDFDEGNLVIRKDTEFFEPRWDEIYSLTKCFGLSYTKRHAFHVSIPIEDIDRQSISFLYKKGHREWKLVITYQSHFSRLTKRFKNSYWNINDHFMARHVSGDIVIYKIRKMSVYKRELKLLVEMLNSRNHSVYKYAFYRFMSFIYGLFYRGKQIWLYIDKIYKAGDSSEYIYKYAVAQNNPNIKHYYLVDKNCSDCKRLKTEGYKPLVRGTFKHRMIFLLADMVVISNSTVFAYNDYTLATSAYIRDIVKFKVACVQHGMSVQKIAVAQNRLRDNISLYFCASPYEIKNLSRPIYGYQGYDVLKLTGVPRYDGLVNRDKKQILITPTWRMQAAVPVTKNEGVARDYNPLFKETDYYRVYNSLINDKRLIEAAKKYGYRIVYVLHPIVSPQVDDFDKNEYVDIVPAIGDMSYEKVFCESSLMVTDFSGVQFDFAYMRKPLVYLHHKDIPQHYEEGTFIYDTMAFGEICHDNDELIDVLCEYMASGCVMKEKYVKRADDFFAFSDHDNCKRIYNEMTKYMKV